MQIQSSIFPKSIGQTDTHRPTDGSGDKTCTNTRLHCIDCIVTHTHNHFTALWNFVWDNPGEPVPEETFTHSHLSWSSIIPYLLPPSCSVYVPDSLFPLSLSKFSLVYLLAWHSPLHTPYISSPSHCLLFAAHTHTIATCFAVVPRLCHLILVSLLTQLITRSHPVMVGDILHVILNFDLSKIPFCAFLASVKSYTHTKN